MQSVVAGQAPITLEWKKYLGSKTGAKKHKTSIRTPPLRTSGKQSGDYYYSSRQKPKKEDKAKQKKQNNVCGSMSPHAVLENLFAYPFLPSSARPLSSFNRRCYPSLYFFHGFALACRPRKRLDGKP